MWLRSSRSWEIHVNRWGQVHDWALWIRAAERIDVPPGGPVPGPLDIEPPPEPSMTADRDLADGWREWWLGIVRAQQQRQAYVDYGPYEFEGLAGWPDLHRVVRQRWREAEAWHRSRKARALRPSLIDNEVVLDVERELGRRVRPFEFSFFLLPVLDDEVRALAGNRYLVPEHIYDGPKWRDWLRPLVLSYGR
jgi:hypothetical protein